MINLIRAKCIILGSSCVGKSAILNSFLGDGSQFLKNYLMTLGVDVQQKQIRIPDTDAAVQLFFCDCSGKDFFRPIVQNMSSQTPLVMLVYDVTSEESLLALENIFKDLQSQNGSLQIEGLLFANKTDLTNRRRVSPKAGNDLAKKLGLTYFEGSAKEQQGLETPFFFLANEWYKKYVENAEALKSIA